MTIYAFVGRLGLEHDFAHKVYHVERPVLAPSSVYTRGKVDLRRRQGGCYREERGSLKESSTLLRV